MNQFGEDRLDEGLGDEPAIGGDAEDTLTETEEEIDADELGEDEPIDTTDFEAAIEDLDESDSGLAAADEELSQKEQNARSLAARRAIEKRMEQKQLEEDLDYLDLDLDE